MSATEQHLVLVDDEPATRTTLSAIFTHLGYKVRAAEDGFAALALIREQVPDVLLSDLNMPRMSGFELLSVVRRLHPSIHVIATSAAFAGKDVPHGIAADGFYEKASALPVLFDLIETKNRFQQRRDHRAMARMPIWMKPTGKLPTDQIYVLIGCPECLRCFPKLIGGSKCLICETACIYCQSKITYAIVDSDDFAFDAAEHVDAAAISAWNL